MIEHTFQLLPSVGAKKEKVIWESGVRTWDDFLAADSIECVKPAFKEKSDPIIMQAEELLKSEDAGALADLIPKPEHWRMYRHFMDDAAYLDIETDGLSRDALVTVVTVHRKNKTYTLTEGFDLDSESLSDALKGSKMLVTFCIDVRDNISIFIPCFHLGIKAIVAYHFLYPGTAIGHDLLFLGLFINDLMLKHIGVVIKKYRKLIPYL